MHFTFLSIILLSHSKYHKPLHCFCCQLFQIFPAVVFETCKYSNIPHESLLVCRKISLTVGLLHFRLQTAWLYSGISSRLDDTAIPLCLGSQSLVCKSGVHIGQVRMRFGQESLEIARPTPRNPFHTCKFINSDPLDKECNQALCFRNSHRRTHTCCIKCCLQLGGGNFWVCIQLIFLGRNCSQVGLVIYSHKYNKIYSEDDGEYTYQG